MFDTWPGTIYFIGWLIGAIIFGTASWLDTELRRQANGELDSWPKTCFLCVFFGGMWPGLVVVLAVAIPYLWISDSWRVKAAVRSGDVNDIERRFLA